MGALLAGALVAACGGSARVAAPSETELTALRADAVRSVSALVPIAPRLGGRALIVLPDRALIEAHGIRRPAKGTLSPEAVAGLAEALEIGVIATVEGLRHGAVFDDLTVVGDADPASVPVGHYDYKLWLLTESPERWRWYLAHAGATAPVAFDQAQNPTARLAAFNAGVVATATALGAAPR